MSTRRSRIKPAINLAASRRTAGGSKPSGPAAASRPNHRAPATQKGVEDVHQERPDEAPLPIKPGRQAGHKTLGVVNAPTEQKRRTGHKTLGVADEPTKLERQSGHGTLGVVVDAPTEPERQSGHERLGVADAPAEPESQTGDTTLGVVDAPTEPERQTAHETLRVGQPGVRGPEVAAGEEGQEKGCDEIARDALVEISCHGAEESITAGTVPAADNTKQQEAKSTDAAIRGAKKNPVRRKRISAAPNFNKRRLPGTAERIALSKAKRTDSKGGTRIVSSAVDQPVVDPRKLDQTKADHPTIVDDLEAGQLEGDQPKIAVTDHPPVDTLPADLHGSDISEADAPNGNTQSTISTTTTTTHVSHSDLEEQTSGREVTVIDGSTREGEEEPNDLTETDGRRVEPPAIQRKILSQPLQKFDQKEDHNSVPKHKDVNRHKSGNNIYKKKLDEMRSMKKDEAASRRRKKFDHLTNADVDPSKMRMRDLIYFNPKENRMSSKSSSAEGNPVASRQSIPRSDEEEEADPEETGEPSLSAAPQVTIGPDGNIVLDQQSLVKVVTPKRKLDESEITEVKEDSSTTTYSSFRKATYSAPWSEIETAKFYRALSAVGTDFSMINAIFPNRRRRELKNKFKREERKNAPRMERSLNDIRTFDFCDFQNMDEDDGTENTKSLKGDGKASRKPEKKKRKQHEDPQGPYIAPRSSSNCQPSANETTPQTTEELLPSSVASEHSIIEEGTAPIKALENLKDPFGSSAPVHRGSADEEGEGSHDEEEENYNLADILGKPTRSGRQPKRKEPFTIQESLSQPGEVRPEGSSGTGKRKIGKQRVKGNRKRKKRGKSITDATVTGPTLTETIPEVNMDRVPPLHPDSRGSIYNPLRGFQFVDQSAVRPSPAVRTEHYLITYPNGRRTLIQMPVPQESGENFDFVFNVLPSPVREGGVLQLGIVPRPNNGSSSRNGSECLLAQSGDGTRSPATPVLHAPSTSAGDVLGNPMDLNHSTQPGNSHGIQSGNSPSPNCQSPLPSSYVEVLSTAGDPDSLEHPLPNYGGLTSSQGNTRIPNSQEHYVEVLLEAGDPNSLEHTLPNLSYDGLTSSQGNTSILNSQEHHVGVLSKAGDPNSLEHSLPNLSYDGLTSSRGNTRILNSQEHSPSERGYEGSTSTQGNGHILNSLGQSPSRYDDSGSLNHDALSQHKYGAVIPPLVRTPHHDMIRTDSRNREPPPKGRSRSHHKFRFPSRTPDRSPSYHMGRGPFYGKGSSGLSEQSLSAITDPPSCLQRSFSGLSSPLPHSEVIQPIASLPEQHQTVGEGSTLPSPQMGQTLPPIASLLSGYLEMGGKPPVQILATLGQAPPGDHCSEESLTNTASNTCRDVEAVSNSDSGGVIEVGTSLMLSEPSAMNHGAVDGVVYVSDLENPMPGTSQVSDQIVAQLVDVTSSVQQEDSLLAENEEAFVPAV